MVGVGRTRTEKPKKENRVQWEIVALALKQAKASSGRHARAHKLQE